METEPPSNPQDLTAFVTDLLEQIRAVASMTSAPRRHAGQPPSARQKPTREPTAADAPSSKPDRRPARISG